jgi:hypothetical protein
MLTSENLKNSLDVVLSFPSTQLRDVRFQLQMLGILNTVISCEYTSSRILMVYIGMRILAVCAMHTFSMDLKRLTSTSNTPATALLTGADSPMGDNNSTNLRSELCVDGTGFWCR